MDHQIAEEKCKNLKPTNPKLIKLINLPEKLLRNINTPIFKSTRRSIKRLPSQQQQQQQHQQQKQGNSSQQTSTPTPTPQLQHHSTVTPYQHNFRAFIVRPIITNNMKPLIILINPKSGGNLGNKLLKKFMWLLNPRQVFDLSQLGNPKFALVLFFF